MHVSQAKPTQTLNSCVLVVLWLMSLSGCSPEPQQGTLEIFDPNGNVTASGQLTLPADFPDEGETFESEWQLESANLPFPTRSVSTGKYTGEVLRLREKETIIKCDLNGADPDDSVHLVGAVTKDQRFAGEALFITIRGEQYIGTFSFTPLP